MKRYVRILFTAALMMIAQCLCMASLAFAESQEPEVELVRTPEAAAEAVSPEGEITAPAGSRIMLCIPYAAEIETYGAVSAAYYRNHYLLAYESETAAGYAYDRLCLEYGDMRVIQDMPIHLSSAKGWGTEYMHLDEKASASGGSSVTVAVLDSGIDRSHGIFSGTTVQQGYDFINNDEDPEDENSHGTAVAGIIAESTPSCVSVLPVKIADADGNSSIVNAVYGLDYAAKHGADVINISLGLSCDEETFEKIKGRFNSVNTGSAVIVCAAGNNGTDMDAAGEYDFPAELDQTICVSAFGKSGAISGFSNYGSAVDFTAPGEKIDTAVPGGNYYVENGTSFSAPYISAAAAVIKSEESGLDPDAVKTRLIKIAEDMGEEGKDPYYGYGCPIFGEDSGDDQVSDTISQDPVKTDQEDNSSVEGTSGTSDEAEMPEAVIVKSASRMTAKAKTVKVKYKKLRKKTQTIKASKAFTVKRAAGKVTYTKLSGNKKITVDKKTGKIRIKKKLRRGTYTVKVKIRDPGSDKYKARSVKVKLRIRVY